MLGSLKMPMASDETVTYVSRWSIGASGAHTKISGVPGTGFASVSRTAAGSYTVTFSDVAQGGLIDFKVTHWPAAAAAPLLGRPSKSTYSASAKTVAYETWDLAVPTKTELASGDEVTLVATFLRTK